MTRVLHIIPTYEPAWAFGGTVTATSHLCREMADQGLDVSVYTMNVNGKGGVLDVPVNRKVDLGGVKVFYFGCTFGESKAFYSRGLSEKLKSTIAEFDIIDVSAIWQLAQVKTSKLCLKHRIPYVVTPHSSLMSWAFDMVGNQLRKKLYWHLVGKETIQRAQAIHYLSEGEREVSEERSYPVPSFIIPNGIRYERFVRRPEQGKEIRKMLDIGRKTFLILFLGRIHPKKGIELLLQAMPKCIAINRDIHLLIAGPTEDGNYGKKLKGICNNLNLNDYVTWHGPVPNKEVIQFYSSANLLALPSLVEGVSMGTIEAMAAGLPVLMSDRVANYREIARDNAGIVVKCEKQSVQAALLRIVQDSEQLEILGRNVLLSVQKRYDIRNIAKLNIQAYKDIIEGTRTSVLAWR